jgi:hypothetical protein
VDQGEEQVSDELMRRIGFKDGQVATRRRVEAVIANWDHTGHQCSGDQCPSCVLAQAKTEVQRALEAG